MKTGCLATALLLILSVLYIFDNEKPVVKGNSIHFVDGASFAKGRIAYEKKWVGFPSLQDVVDCKAVMSKSTKNSEFPKSLPRLAASDLAQDSKDCELFLFKHGFNRNPDPSQEEVDFSLAYIILFHKDLDQVLFLLRAIYQPQNVYCLAVDLHAGQAFVNGVRAVARCFPNVFIAKKLEYIVYAGYSRFQADLHCMQELLTHRVQWKYLLNLPGQEFPLRTNLELVQIIKLFKGSNDILGASDQRSLPRRYRIKHHVIIDKRTGKKMITETVGRKGPAPHNLKVVKGGAYGSFSRAFVQFVLTDQRAKDLIEWSKDVESPDEYVFPTLHFSQTIRVPGRYQGPPETKRYLSMFAAWEKESPCASMFVRWICIFSTADLPMLMARPELFANKFYIDHHPTALHCLDQYLFNLTVSATVRNLDYYKNLPWVESSSLE